MRSEYIDKFVNWAILNPIKSAVFSFGVGVLVGAILW